LQTGIASHKIPFYHALCYYHSILDIILVF